MQPGFQVLYCIVKLQINGIACYYVSGEETSINLNMLENRSIDQHSHHAIEKFPLSTRREGQIAYLEGSGELPELGDGLLVVLDRLSWQLAHLELVLGDLALSHV